MFDDLDAFRHWWMTSRMLLVPGINALSFYDKAVGIVVYRQPPYQVQLFISQPNENIISHTHPNVDSFEVWLHGMEFFHNGNLQIDLAAASVMLGESGIPKAYGTTLRIRPNDTHGGRGSANGGAFLSIQKWLHGVAPTCVAADWGGSPMDENHGSKITTGLKS